MRDDPQGSSHHKPPTPARVRICFEPEAPLLTNFIGVESSGSFGNRSWALFTIDVVGD